MERHRLRYLLIAICFMVTVLALVGGLALGVANTEAVASLVTAIGLLGAALTDASLVEKRRVTAGKKAVVDDVGGA
jgi:hypothetical protein